MWNGQAKKTKLKKLQILKKRSLLTDKNHGYKENLGRQISTKCKKTE